MKKTFLASILLSSLIVTGSALAADTPVAAVDLNDDNFVKTTLTAAKGQTVTVHLLSGLELTGKVADIGEIAVRISELTGKEYFEAIVRTEDIAAVVRRAK